MPAGNPLGYLPPQQQQMLVQALMGGQGMANPMGGGPMPSMPDNPGAPPMGAPGPMMPMGVGPMAGPPGGRNPNPPGGPPMPPPDPMLSQRDTLINDAIKSYGIYDQDWTDQIKQLFNGQNIGSTSPPPRDESGQPPRRVVPEGPSPQMGGAMAPMPVIGGGAPVAPMPIIENQMPVAPMPMIGPSGMPPLSPQDMMALGQLLGVR